jgi:hypothetical protein
MEWVGSVRCEKFWRNFVYRIWRYWHWFDQFCIDFGALTKRSKMPQNISFGSKGVDPVRSLRTIPKQLNLAKFRVNGASSASFVSTFVH